MVDVSTLLRDLPPGEGWRSLVGERIAVGSSRTVYELAADPAMWVVKHERDGARKQFNNVAEWLLWQDVQYIPDAEKWFAPCGSISPDGTALIQRRVTPVTMDQLPEKVPIWATDLKRSNWGLVDDRLVVVDYARTLLINGAATRRMKKAVWFDA